MRRRRRRRRGARALRLRVTDREAIAGGAGAERGDGDGNPARRVAFYNDPRLRGIFYQIVLFVVVLWLGYEFVVNARANLRAARITTGFGFLDNTAGFSVNQTLIPYTRVRYLRPRVPGRSAQHAAGFGHRHFLRHHPRLHGRHRPAVAELAVAADRRRLCRADPQPAAAVPDPVLVPRGARRAARTAPEPLPIRRGLPQQSRPVHSAADLRRGSRGGVCGFAAAMLASVGVADLGAPPPGGDRPGSSRSPARRRSP